MEPNTTPPRVTSYTHVCKRAARGLFQLLEEIDKVSSATDDTKPDLLDSWRSMRDLAKRRHLFCSRTAPVDPEAIEPISQTDHRAHLHPSHPLALPEGDPRRLQPMVCVGEFNPLTWAPYAHEAAGFVGTDGRHWVDREGVVHDDQGKPVALSPEVYAAWQRETLVAGPLDLVFTGEPPNLVFVEAERPPGHGVDVGEWLTREDGCTVLRLRAAE